MRVAGHDGLLRYSLTATMYTRPSVKSRSSDLRSIQVKISSCSMPRNRKATGCKDVRSSHNRDTHRQQEATAIVPMWMEDGASRYNDQLLMTFPCMREVGAIYWQVLVCC